MAFGGTSLDPGPVPSIDVARDLVGSIHFPREKWADPREGMTGEFGVDANPARVANRDRGVSDFDPGLQYLPAVEGVLAAGVVYIKNIYLFNRSSAVVSVSIRDNAGTFLFENLELTRGQMLNIPRYGARMDGIKWVASAGTAVSGQIHGWNA